MPSDEVAMRSRRCMESLPEVEFLIMFTSKASPTWELYFGLVQSTGAQAANASGIPHWGASSSQICMRPAVFGIFRVRHSRSRILAYPFHTPPEQLNAQVLQSWEPYLSQPCRRNRGPHATKL